MKIVIETNGVGQYRVSAWIGAGDSISFSQALGELYEQRFESVAAAVSAIEEWKKRNVWTRVDDAPVSEV